MSSKDKDFRLITLVVDVCPLPLRELFLKYAMSDPGPSVPYTSLDNYMLLRKHDVEKLMKLPPKTIRKDQFHLIYPKANEAEWDVSLLSALLLGLFGTEVQGTEKSLINIIREIRNKLQHQPGSLTTTDEVFDTTWNEIETAATTLAQIAGGPTYETEIKKRIEETRVNNLPKLGDILKSWYENIIHSISETSLSSYHILEATTEKHETKTGHTGKRMKTVDPILKKLREQFAQTFYRELPDDYDQPKEASTIRQNLTHDHHVTICGYEKSKYLACALSIIAALDYDRSRCVEMTKPEDWRHVDPEDVDLILYHDPFSLSVTENKRELFDVFQALMHVSTKPDDQARIDVVIVTEKSKLEENGGSICHNIFENMVVLYEPTSEKEPMDLENHQLLNERTQGYNVLGNMIAYSDAFIQQRRSNSIDPGLLESAKEKFKRHKAVVITGPTGCGKSALAVSLVCSNYKQYECVVLAESSDWKHVTLGKICVIIIDDFAGKCKYNASLAESWFNRFDLIYAAVSMGKLNVIITCETSHFAKVLKNLTGHPLLSHRIKIPKQGVGITIKEEPISDNDLDNDEPEQGQQEISDSMDVSINENNANPNKEQQQEQCLLEGRLMESLEMSVKIKYCCEVLNGKAFILGGNSIIALLDTNTFAIRERSLPHEASDVSCIDEQQIVIFMQKEKLVLNANLSSSDIELGTSSVIPVEHNWIRLVRKGTQYIMCTETAVFIYSLKWEKLGTISHLNNKPLFTERSWRFFSRKKKDENVICDIIVGDSNIIIASEEKLVVTDKVGNIKKTFKPGGYVTRFDDSWIFVCGNGKINIVKDTGKFLGIFVQDSWLLENTTFSYQKDQYCIHFGQICKKLLVSREKKVKVFRVQ